MAFDLTNVSTEELQEVLRQCDLGLQYCHVATADIQDELLRRDNTLKYAGGYSVEFSRTKQYGYLQLVIKLHGAKHDCLLLDDDEARQLAEQLLKRAK